MSNKDLENDSDKDLNGAEADKHSDFDLKDFIPKELNSLLDTAIMNDGTSEKSSSDSDITDESKEIADSAEASKESTDDSNVELFTDAADDQSDEYSADSVTVSNEIDDSFASYSEYPPEITEAAYATESLPDDFDKLQSEAALADGSDPSEFSTDGAEALYIDDDNYLSDDSALSSDSEADEASYDGHFSGNEPPEESGSEALEYDESFDRTESDEQTTVKKTPAPKVKTRAIDSLFDFIELFIFSLAAVLLITTFLFRHSVVDGSSMENTLFEGEHIIISNLFYTPERGDIIVCEDYTTNLRKPIVKRVIGIAGDHVEIDYSGNVKINGKLIDEDYVYIDPWIPYFDEPVDVIVPEGELFVMGDHRNVSTDSRDIGTIKEDSILGKVLLRFYPFENFGRVE